MPDIIQLLSISRNDLVKVNKSHCGIHLGVFLYVIREAAFGKEVIIKCCVFFLRLKLAECFSHLVHIERRSFEFALTRDEGRSVGI